MGIWPQSRSDKSQMRPCLIRGSAQKCHHNGAFGKGVKLIERLCWKPNALGFEVCFYHFFISLLLVSVLTACCMYCMLNFCLSRASWGYICFIFMTGTLVNTTQQSSHFAQRFTNRIFIYSIFVFSTLEVFMTEKQMFVCQF